MTAQPTVSGSGRRSAWICAALALFFFIWPTSAMAADLDWEGCKALGRNIGAVGGDLIMTFTSMIPGFIAKGNDAFNSGMRLMISAFMSVWTIYQLMRMLSVSHANSPAQSIDIIFNRLLLYIILMSITATNLGEYTSRYIIPIYTGIVNLGGKFLGEGVDGCVAATGTGFQALGQAGSYYMCAMGNAFGKGLSVGLYLIINSVFNVGSFPITQLVAGFIIAWVYGWQMFRMPIMFLDCMLRVLIVLTFLPVIVMAYVFKPTRGMVKMALTSLGASALTFLITAIIVAICIEILNSKLEPIVNKVFPNVPISTLGPLEWEDGLVLIIIAFATGAMIKTAPKIAAELIGFTGQMGEAAEGTVAAMSSTVATAAGAAGGAIGMASSVSSASSLKAITGAMKGAGGSAAKAGDAGMK